MALTGSNTYSGGTIFRGGAVEFSSLDNLGSGALTFDGGALRYASGNTTDISTRTVTFAADGAIIDTNSGTVTYAQSVGNGGAGSLTKTGEGGLILTGSNNYSGGTVIHGGLLAAGNNSAMGAGAVVVEKGVFLVKDGVSVGNTVRLAGGSYQREISGSLAAAVDAVSDLGGRDTAARILAGTSGATTLVTAFAADSAAANDGMRRSDVYSLHGTGSNVFVLELSIADAGNDAFLGWLDEDTNLWVNAIEGNTANNASGGQLGFHGTFAEFQAVPGNGTNLSTYIGAWGFTDTSVWAVLNHNSDFSIVPEPSALALLLLGGLTLLRRRR